jgi:hypothetical protein
MFQSIWTIFREPTLVLAKVALFQILPLKCSVKRFSVLWFRLYVYPVLCGAFYMVNKLAFVGQKNFDISRNVFEVPNSSPSITRMIKSRRMNCAGHVARIGERRGVYRVLPEGKRPLGRSRRRWEDNITMDL